jgi:hypothetical protein
LHFHIVSRSTDRRFLAAVNERARKISMSGELQQEHGDVMCAAWDLLTAESYTLQSCPSRGLSSCASFWAQHWQCIGKASWISINSLLIRSCFDYSRFMFICKDAIDLSPYFDSI